MALRGWHRHPAEVANKTPARYWHIVNAMSVVYPRTLPQLPDCIPHPMHHQPTKPSTKSPPGGLPSHFRSTSGSLPVYFRFTSGSLPVEISVQLTKKNFFMFEIFFGFLFFFLRGGLYRCSSISGLTWADVNNVASCDQIDLMGKRVRRMRGEREREREKKAADCLSLSIFFC